MYIETAGTVSVGLFHLAVHSIQVLSDWLHTLPKTTEWKQKQYIVKYIYSEQ